MSALIRRARTEDASHIIVAHVTSIREICAKDYTREQIKAWAGRNFTTDKWISSIQKDAVWVVELNDFVEGFAHFKKDTEDTGWLLGLYFTPRVTGQGIGSQLIDVIFEHAKSLGIKIIGLQSTLTSLKFYEKKGFKILEDKPKVVQMNGVEMPALYMEKHL